MASDGGQNERRELLERVGGLMPRIAARASAAERLRRVPDETARELREAGLFRAVAPRRFGGFEQDYDVLLELIMELAAACASTAWVFAIAAGQQALVANMPLAAQQDIWGDDPDAVTCGSFPPSGTAVPAAGGFSVSGRWSFASGCDIAPWAVLGTALPGEGGKRVPCFILVPAADFVIEDDWFTIGLAATGSKTVVLRDAFVPAHRTMPVARMMRCRSVDEVDHPHPTFRLPMLACVPSSLAAVALGAARGAAEQFIAATRGRVTRGGIEGVRNPVAEFVTVQLRVAEALAAVDAGATTLLRDNRAAIATLRGGALITVADRIAIRRNQSFAGRLALQAVDAVAVATGAHGLFQENPVHRAARDVAAVTRHISLIWDSVGTMVGQHALGLEPRPYY